ncbi:nuclease-related domain-containing protein [Pseudarthrobacter sp. 1C304]|uniref:nuclease-related domain-containing protein n=1 Tax=Pseudarthrobacter sp. 1C304 TaxID=3457438 RepID=UPI003FCF59B9
MAAGDRAAEQSRLAAERVQRLRRELEQAERNAHAWSAGAAGEAAVADRMTRLEALGWLALHDVHWPGRPKANLDHILVGPGGILIVDAKNWSGDVQLSHGVLRQNGYNKESTVSGILQQCSALAALLEPEHRRLVQGWICLVGQPHLQGTTSNGIRIEGLDTLRGAVADLPAVLDPVLVPTIHAHLQGLLGGATSPRLMTTAQFKPHNVNHHDGAAASLGRVRARTQVAARQPGPRGQNRRQSKSPSCAVFLFQVMLLFVGVMLLMNFAANYRPAAPPAPYPAPGVSQTVPAR